MNRHAIRFFAILFTALISLQQVSAVSHTNKNTKPTHFSHGKAMEQAYIVLIKTGMVTAALLATGVGLGIAVKNGAVSPWPAAAALGAGIVFPVFTLRFLHSAQPRKGFLENCKTTLKSFIK
jgi:heme O synthase-like polyprenyltransferase